MYNEKIEETLEEIRLKKNEEDGVAPSKIMFLESCKNLIENNYQKHSTKIRYHFYIISFENFILNRFKTKDIPISFLTTKFFEDYIKHESSKKTFSQNNINLSISAIKSFLLYLPSKIPDFERKPIFLISFINAHLASP